jgi:CRISPR-associated protein Csm5
MANATLTTITPVHIGNGTLYNKGIDFIQLDNKIGIIDEHKVLNKIGVENINQWVAAIEKYNPETDYNKQPLLDLLKGRGFSNIKIEEISKRTCNLSNPTNNSSQLKEHYRTSLEGVCIPGSSLKGSLKTAIYESLTGYNEINLQSSDIKQRRNGKTEFKDFGIDKKLFGNNANEKTTRFLKIADIHFKDCETEIFEIKILNKRFDDWQFKPGQQNLIECIPAKMVAKFKLKIDTALFDINKKNDLKKTWSDEKTTWLESDVMSSMVNDFTKRMLSWEIKRLEDEEMGSAGDNMIEQLRNILSVSETCSDNEFVIRVGANSGWSFMTGEWFLNEDLNIIDEDDLASLRKKIQKRDYTNMDLWPKTRKISSKGNVFGFVKIKMEL